jgi:hypothetical protein
MAPQGIMGVMQPTTEPRLADTQAAALAADVKPAQLRSWLHRGALIRHGHDHRGRALIDLDELEALQKLKQLD